MSDIKIIIDNFEFKLISKSVMTKDTDYYKVEIISINLTTREQTTFYAYISQSGTVWRFCSKRPGNSIEKYDNYIQATILDFRLQSFIFSNYDSLPLYSQPKITCDFDSDKIFEYNTHIRYRGIEFENILPFIINENTKKNIFNAYIKTLPIYYRYFYTSKNFKDKYSETEIDVYKHAVSNIIVDMLKGNEKKYEQYKKENNKYESVPHMFYHNSKVEFEFMVSFYFDKNWFNHEQKIELQHYLKNFYDIVDKNNKVIILGTDVIPKVPIMKYDMDFEFGKFNNDFFAIRLKNKQNKNILIVQIGKILLNLNTDHISRSNTSSFDLHTDPSYRINTSSFDGYYICNIIDENVKITKYGLYETYYTEPDYIDWWSTGKTNYLDKYITKPLEYRVQIDYNFCSGPYIYNTPYVFMCDCNVKKFLIKELIDEGKVEKLIEEETAKELIDKKKDVMNTLQLQPSFNKFEQNQSSDSKNKYLKYKQKYINLKNKINRM